MLTIPDQSAFHPSNQIFVILVPCGALISCTCSNQFIVALVLPFFGCVFGACSEGKE